MSQTVVQAPYPPEVEDVLDNQQQQRGYEDSVCAVGASGYAVVAAAGSSRAHLFAVAGGSGGGGGARDALPLPLPTSGSGVRVRPPRLAVWETSATLSIAALDAGGALRLFSRVDPLARAAPRPGELRVARALALSARAEEGDAFVEALELVHARDADCRDSLFVFGASGSAALVRLGEVAPSAQPLERLDPAAADAGKRSGISFGKLFYSALRSISGDTRPDAADFTAGTGVHRIVGAGAVNGFLAACVVREGGAVELWGEEHLLWSVDIFDVVGARATEIDRRVVSAAVSKEDTIICLLEETRDEHSVFRIVGFAATRDSPKAAAVEIDLREFTDGVSGIDVVMTLSAGLAYLHVPNTRFLSWVSVARGLDVQNQVHGSADLPEGSTVLHVLDATHTSASPNNDDVSGGLVACLCSSSVTLVSSGVPAPISMQGGEVVPPPVQNGEQDVSSMLWRAQAQFRAGQIGAVRASLRGLYRATFINGTPSQTFLGEIVLDSCQRIISSQVDPRTAPMALLVDSELERRQDDYNCFVRLLGDAQVFAAIRDEAPSITDDRLWDALPADVRHAVLSLGEKLNVARAIREVENAHVSGSSTQQFRDSATTSLLSEGMGTRTGSAVPSTFGEDLREIETELSGGSSVVARALHNAGVTARAKEAMSDDASILYRFPLHFHHFLPALRDCLVEVQARARQPQELDAVGPNTVQRALRSVTLLACQAAIAVTGAARDTRSQLVSQLERDHQVLLSFRDWSCSENARNALDVFIDSALEQRAGGRQSELQALQNAATRVTDELLACTRSALCDSVPSMSNLNMAKKRRVNEGDDNSAWGRARYKALERLRSARLDKDALHLAEKYNDFGTIMALKKDSDDFDEYFANAIENYGDQFGFYALRWLEDRSEIKLLLKGKQASSSFQAGLSTRTDRVKELVSTYFGEERAGVSNLAWMHWLDAGDLNLAAGALCKQTRCVAVPGRPESLANTHVLSSVAKLTVLAATMELEEAPENKTPEMVTEREALQEAENYVNGKLHLVRVQTKLNDESAQSLSHLLEVGELVKNVINAAPVDSSRLAESAAVALEAVGYADLQDNDAHDLVDYVWRRCVEKQGDTWSQIVASARQISDDQLRERLAGTALYQAAMVSETNETAMKAIVDRDAFSIAKFEEEKTRSDLERIVQTTVALAQGAR